MGVRNPLNFPSYVYVWVMNHLRVVVGDAFGLFWGFLVGFMEKKRMKSANLGNFGVLCCGVGIPRNSVGPRQGVACPRRGVVEKEAWISLGYVEA